MSLQYIKKRTLYFALTLAFSGMHAAHAQSTELKDDAFYREKAQELLGKMTLSEKLDVLSGPGMNMKVLAANDGINLSHAVAGVAGYINGVKNKDLNIPATVLTDGPAGIRISPTRKNDKQTYYATAWPIGTLLASTWNTALVQKVGEAMGNEVKEYGADFLLAPGMNLQRNPLAGRNFEYYSEDPVVTGNMAAAMVNGLQSNGIGATIKHFFANEAETNRFFSNSVGEPRAFRELYLRPFQIAVEQAHPWAVMTSYNKVNGAYANHRADLLNDILRQEWGFKGLVMSDWFGGNVAPILSDLTDKGKRDPKAAAAMVSAGNDLIEPGNVKNDLMASYENGSLTQASIDKAMVNILTQVQKTPSYNHYKFSNKPDLVEHAKLARQAADEGIVLLKNNNALPLKEGIKLASFGTNQVNTYKGGTGSGDVNSAYVLSILKGLQAKFMVNESLAHFYQKYFDTHKKQTTSIIGKVFATDEASVAKTAELQTLLNDAAKNDDVGVISIGRVAGEGADRQNAKGDYLLSDAELELINSVSQAFHAQNKKVVVVLNVNGVVDTSQWSTNVDSIVLAYMGGQETGNAVADILSGAANPSGKLAQTFPASYDDVPSAKSFPGVDKNGDGLVDDIYYNEGIYVGYRYYDTFKKAVSYPFGFGLSYTSFNLSDASVDAKALTQDKDAVVNVSVKVSNTGKVAGKEVAQVYVNAPELKLKKPEIELKAFAKTSDLAPSASETLNFAIPASVLASFDQERNEWIIEPGTYNVYVATSSDVSQVKPVTFDVTKEIVVSKTTPNAVALESGVKAKDFVTIDK